MKMYASVMKKLNMKTPCAINVMKGGIPKLLPAVPMSFSGIPASSGRVLSTLSALPARLSSLSPCACPSAGVPASPATSPRSVTLPTSPTRRLS